MIKKIFACLLFTTTIVNVHAQTEDKKWNIGLHFGRTTYNGDLGQGFYRFNQAFYAHGGISVSRWISPRFDLSLALQKGDVGYTENIADNKRFYNQQTSGALLLRYKIQKDDAKFFRPYLFAGMGLMKFADTYKVAAAGTESSEDVKPGTDIMMPSCGFGINLRLSPVINLQLQENFIYTSKDSRDGEAHINNDGFLHHSVGLSFNLGAKKDADKDGVADKNDKCPATPAGVMVDANGCPLDKDGDGIADYLDKCPEVKGAQTVGGCPDADGDGIVDANDACPNDKGTQAMSGCPDTDGDGIADKDDVCPKEKGLKEFSGCPDTDGDGIVDKDDRCPKDKGSPALKGCPDRDADGIADIDDKCPDVNGIAANKGCPEVKEEVKQLFAQALQGIQFETGKDIIRPTSFAILDKVVKVMQDNPNYNLDINGHTDDVGDDANNLTLSQKRAEAVKKYLTDKGINAARLKPTGFGETIPVGDNKTAAGRAKNRRVEFVVQF